MESIAERRSKLTAVTTQHAALLDAMASLWEHAGAGRLIVRDAAGQEIYASGVPASGVLSVDLLDGTLSVEGGSPAFQPMLAAQAHLLQEALKSDAQAELLVDELMRTTDHLVALFEVSAAARAGRDLAGVMQTCVEQAARLTGSARGLLVVRESWRVEAIPRVFSFPEPGSASASCAANLLSAAARCREHFIVNTTPEYAALCGDALGDVRRLACAPITIGGRVDAALYAVDKPIDFTNGDLKLITALADAAASFLERERSYERELAQMRVRRELEIAAEIQSRLLPSDVPTLPGVQVAALWRPSREVGGDFFDVQILPDGKRLALALGDVTGKGVPAALLMAMAHGLLRMGFASTGSPAEAVRLMNSGLADDLSRATRLLTLFAATFDPASGHLSAVNCGHSPILVCRRGEVDLWEADGPPMGVLPQVLSAERERILKSGDALIALSDGFSDARNADGKRIGVQPLIDCIRDTAASSDASTLADALWQLVDEFGRGGSREDDQTMIVMKVE